MLTHLFYWFWKALMVKYHLQRKFEGNHRQYRALQTNLQKWPKNVWHVFVHYRLVFPACVAMQSWFGKSKKEKRFLTFLCVWVRGISIDGAACPLCPPTINHISEVLSLLRWPLYTTHIITISPHSKTFINIHWLLETCLWICNCKQL